MQQFEGLSIEEPLKLLLLNKDWKERKEGYIQLRTLWENNPDGYHILIPILLKESAVPALEAAIDCLISINKPIPQLLGFISNIKIKDKIKQHTIKYYNKFVNDINKILISKNIKNIVAMLEILIDIIAYNTYDIDEEIKNKLCILLQHQDKKVRSKTIEFIVQMYKKEGNSIFSYLEGIKPIVKKEIEEEINKIKDNNNIDSNDNYNIDNNDNNNTHNNSNITNNNIYTNHDNDNTDKFIVEEKKPSPSSKVFPKNDISIKSTNNHINKNIMDKIDIPSEMYPDIQLLTSDNWKERVGVLERIKELTMKYKLTEEIMIMVSKRLSDINIQALALSVEILKLNSNDISNNLKRNIIILLITRLKEKKASLIESILELMLLMDTEIDIISNHLKDKNPEIRKNLIIFLRRMNTSEVLENVKICLNDQIGAVRELAMEYFAEKIIKNENNRKYINGVDDIKIKRINKIIESKRSNLTVENNIEIKKCVNDGSKVIDLKMENKIINRNNDRTTVKSKMNNDRTPVRNNDKTSMKNKRKIIIDGNIDEYKNIIFRMDDCNKIKSMFYEKYSFLKEREWNKRLDGINHNIEEMKGESINDIIIFIYAHNDSVFQVTQRLYDLINMVKIIESGKNLVFLFLRLLEVRFNDIKLRNKIILFLLELTNEYKNMVLNFILYYIKQKRKGKGFSDGIKILKEILKNITIEDKFIFEKYTGVEKEQIKEIEEIIGSKHDKYNEYLEIPQDTNNFITNNSENDKQTNMHANKQTIKSINIEEERKIRREAFNKNIFLEINGDREKNGDENNIFTQQFLERIKYGEDIRSLFDSIDKILVSDIILKYFYKDNLTDKYYFNNLILYFIEKNYILSDYELKMIIKIIINNKWYNTLEGIEKIYPLSKLFNIYQSLILSYYDNNTTLNRNKDEMKNNILYDGNSTNETKSFIILPENIKIINKILEQIVNLIKKTGSFRGNINFYKKLKDTEEIDNNLINIIIKSKVDDLLVRNNYNSFISPMKKRMNIKKNIEEIEENISRISIHEDNDESIHNNEANDELINKLTEDNTDNKVTITFPKSNKESHDINISKQHIENTPTANMPIDNNNISDINNNNTSKYLVNDNYNDKHIININNNNNITTNNDNTTTNINNIFMEEFNSNADTNINIEDILNNLIDKDIRVSINNLNRLYSIAVSDIKILYFISNSIINSILIQLKDKNYKDNITQYSSDIEDINIFNTLIFNILIILSKEPLFLLELSSNTLHKLFQEMIRLENIDILINLINNITVETVLSIYLSLLSDNTLNEEVIIYCINIHKEKFKEIIECNRIEYNKNNEMNNDNKYTGYNNNTKIMIDNVLYVLKKFLDKNYINLIKKEKIFKTIKLYIKNIIDLINNDISNDNIKNIIEEYKIDGYLKILVENIYNKELDYDCIRNKIKDRMDEVNKRI